jgi:hypothetical protein
MWFELYNSGAATAPLDNYGLLSSSFVPKPAFAAFEAVSLHADTQGGSCGNFSAPKIKIRRRFTRRSRGRAPRTSTPARTRSRSS